MAEVTLTIGGRKYTMMCADGQERQLMTLAKALNDKVALLNSRRPMPENMGLVMGALMLASDLSEQGENAAQLERDNAVTAEVMDHAAQMVEKVAQRISALAESIENA
ncbi:MAG TPA: hypothetical protein DD624_06425 [Alphaproteobacteria bacterium]|nr:hypothetical protein [Alphaproteobacteria bacterium]